jgi:hypothetical protein
MNPFGEAERARKRESLLKATEADLEKITAACARARAPLRGEDKIALRVGKVLNRRKVAKHFTIDIGEDRFSYHRNQDCIAAEAKLDGHLVNGKLHASPAGIATFSYRITPFFPRGRCRLALAGYRAVRPAPSAG